MIYNLGICSVGTLKSKISFPVYHTTISTPVYCCSIFSFVDRCLSFCTFLLVIVLSDRLWLTVSDYPFGIFKLLLLHHRKQKWPIYLHKLCPLQAHIDPFTYWIKLHIFTLNNHFVGELQDEERQSICAAFVCVL
jgi:hypothetical protein